jgi:hypothetical protein
MVFRSHFAAVIFGVLLGAAGDGFSQTPSRATLENLLNPPAARPPQPSKPTDKVGKLPLPDKSAIDEATELVRQAYEEDLKKAEADPEPAVAKLLVAAQSTANPAQKFAILLVAEKVAVDANRSMPALMAFDARASAFMFDDAQERLVLLEALQKRSALVDEGVFHYVAQVAQQALDAEQHEQAEKAARLAMVIAKGIERAEKALEVEARRRRQRLPEAVASSLVDEAAALQKTVRVQKSLFAEYAIARTRLAAQPDDPEAAEVVGRHLCFVRGNWGDGLPSLAKGRNASLKSMATRELAILGEPKPDLQSLFALAGDWWKLAEVKDESLAESEVVAIRNHAAGIYARLKGKLSGPLEIAIATKRSRDQTNLSDRGDAENSTRSTKAVNLLALIDPARDVVSGQWGFTPAGLMSDGSAPAKLRVSYALPKEYDFVVEFTRVDGHGDVVQMCSAGGRAFGWVMSGGPGGEFFGFANVDGKGFSNNQTTSRKAGGLATGRRYLAKVKVRELGVAASINSIEVSALKTDYSNMTADRAWSVAEGCVGVGSWKSPTVFHRIEVVPVGR